MFWNQCFFHTTKTLVIVSHAADKRVSEYLHREFKIITFYSYLLWLDISPMAVFISCYCYKIGTKLLLHIMKQY